MPPLPIRRILDSLGMFSPAREALEKISQKRGTGESFRAQLLKHGASEEELDYLDLDDHLKRETLTKDELEYRLNRADTEPLEEVYYRSKLEPIGVSIENWKEMTPGQFSSMRSDDFKESIIGNMQRNTENFIARAQGNEASLAEVMDRLDPRDIHPELERPTLTSEIEEELRPMSKYQEGHEIDTGEEMAALMYNYIPDHFDYQYLDGQINDIAKGIPITPIYKSAELPPRTREQQAIANMGYKDIFGGGNGIGWAQELVRIYDKGKRLTLMVDDLHHAEEYMTDEVISRANTFIESKGQRPMGSDPLPNEERIEAFGESNRNKEAFKRLDAEYDLKEELAEIDYIDLEMAERYEGYMEREVGEVNYLREWESRVEKLITRRTSGPAKAIMDLAYDIDSDLKAFVDDSLPELADRATSYFQSVADSHPNKYFIGDVKIDGFARLAKGAQLEIANDDRGVFFRVTDRDSGWWRVPAGAKDDLPYNAFDGHFVAGMRPNQKFNKWMDLGLYQNPKEFIEAFRPPMKARAFADRYRRVQAPYTDSLFYNRLLETRPESQYFEYTPPGTDETTYDMLVWNMRSSKHGDFRDSHTFAGTPKASAVKNTLGWMRFDIKHLNGEKVMFIDEIQSDWVQKGVRKGSYTSAERRGLEGLFAQTYAASGVPKQPFIKPDKFYAFAFKRALQHAVEKDVDRIAWTTGHMQKNIYPKKDEVVINPDLYHNLYTKYLTEGRYNKGMFMNLQEEILAQGESTRFPNWGAKDYKKLGFKPEEPVHGFDEDGYPQLEGPSFRRFGMHTQYDISMPNVMNRLMRKYTPKDPNAPRKNYIEPLDIHPHMTTDYEWPRKKKYTTNLTEYERVQLGRDHKELSLDEEASTIHFNGVTNYSGRDEKLGAWDHIYYFHDQTVVPSVKIPLELKAEIKNKGLRRFGFVQGGLLRSINREAFAAGSLVRAAKALGRVRKKTEPIKAFHGSPHKFEEFSSEQIGTGEGHQGFGYGLYFADLAKVSEGYQYPRGVPPKDWDIVQALNLADRRMNYKANEPGYREFYKSKSRTENAAEALEERAKGEASIASVYLGKLIPDDDKKIMKFVTSSKDEPMPLLRELEKDQRWTDLTEEDIAQHLPAHDAMEKDFEIHLLDRRDKYRDLIQGAEKVRDGYDPSGKLYEVNLNVNDSQLLDWDKPMGKQHSAVKKKARKLLKKVGDFDRITRDLRSVTEDETGIRQQFSKLMDKITLGPIENQAFNELPVREFIHLIDMNNPYMKRGPTDDYWNWYRSVRAAGAEKLSKAGIKGVKYYDGLSRRKQEGSRNYVVFDTRVIEISKMHGIPIPLAAMLLDQDNGL